MLLFFDYIIPVLGRFLSPSLMTYIFYPLLAFAILIVIAKLIMNLVRWFSHV